jgi:hypothetical protein
MECPHCSTALSEETAACPRCGLEIRACDRAFGAPPPLGEGVADVAGWLSRRERRRAARLLSDLGLAFPQLSFNLLILEVPVGQPFGIYAFWLFNRGHICSQMNRGSQNRNVMLVIDVTGWQAALMVGYGLEPFVGKRHLEEALWEGLPELARRDVVGMAVRCLGHLGETMEDICGRIDRTYGIDCAALCEYEREGGAELPPPHLAGLY